jgi:ABC-2 type transport system ATP-binding protein
MEIQIRCSNGRDLAARVLREELADSARVNATSLGDVVLVTTRNASNLSQQISRWVQDEDLKIFEMRTADDSLQALFNSLMKIHRGEL